MSRREGAFDVHDLPGVLVDPAWLSERLREPLLRIVDLREASAYTTAHIPGAVHLDLAEIGTNLDGCDSVLLPPAEFGALMTRRGISNGHVIVAYDDQWGLAAARLVWALHRYGHDEVAILDGGWDRWQDEGGAVSGGAVPGGAVPEVEPATPGRFEAMPRSDVYADTEWIARRAGADGTALLDTRTPGEFDRGHVPGAVCWDWFNAVPVGSWNVTREPEVLRAEWGALGLDPSDEVVVYCGSGMRAAHTYVVLRNAGFTRVRLYDGSWQAWSMTMGGAGGD